MDRLIDKPGIATTRCEHRPSTTLTAATAKSTGLARARSGTAIHNRGVARYRTTVFSPASPTEAYRYMADFSSIVDWDPSVTEAGLIAGQAGQIGARYRLVLGMPIRDLVLDYEIVEASPPVGPNASGHVALRAETADLVSYDVISFGPHGGGGTDVTYDADLRAKGVRKVVDPLLALMLQVVGYRAKRGLIGVLTALPAEQT